MAPALVAFSRVEDRINRLLADASASAADGPIAAQVIVPAERLADVDELDRLISSIPTDGISSYFIWTPEVTEELLLTDQEVFAALLHLISTLAERGIAVGHQYANYSIAALHDVGINAVAHHLGWVDKGEPAEEQRFMLRSCQTYVPGVRHCQRFPQATQSGRNLDAQQYAERYCECSFCAGSFAAGQHPLDLLLEDELVVFSNGRNRRTPTSRAVAANTWHYLLSRRLEVKAFSELPAAEVIERDIVRATALAGDRDKERLRRLANEIKSA